LHWHAWLEKLGEDEYGVWLGAPTGTAWRRGTEPRTTMAASVTLVPRQSWWVASFNHEPSKYELYVDLSTVPVWDGDEVTMVDLDLDVVRVRRDGTVRLLDEDEFAQHQALFGYPEAVVSQVSQTARHLLAHVAVSEPFTAAYRPWLAQIR
jgi:protein associated with RNAse G/E